MSEGPKPYPVVYDAENGLQYSYQTGYEQITVPTPTDVTVEDINAEDSTDGQIIASNGDGTASWIDNVSAPGGVSGNIQFNASGVFQGTNNFQYDDTGKTLSLTSTGTPNLNIGGDIGSNLNFTNAAQSGSYADILTSSSGVTIHGYSPLMSINAPNGIVIATLTADPATPVEGAVWYNSTSHAWRGYNGTAKGTFTFTAD